ncbi:alpha-L-rhamnosidase [Cohnella cholangitidis]|uniref:alpha-L-rhamnosidase n=1 Tax=Cohnella cholangitidis TaxID=2598458 RepID=A0A7G5BVK0_9BACL|nr:alpha-L-rhamnosidase [Cohnella cholangitidis]QMV40984.1 Bacterial alpha-L-rhamnosidase [Cohnella cholangitidis]
MLQFMELIVENHSHPLGIDCGKPRFAWSFAVTATAQRGQFQSAYRIQVSDDPQSLLSNRGNVWDSGIVQSRSQANIEYEGPELVSTHPYYWRVQAWDEVGVISSSEVSWWEMGLLEEKDWRAQWIGVNPDVLAQWSSGEQYSNSKPLPLLRREFALDREVVRARAYVSGLGNFELRMNGAKVGDHVLEPGWTNYGKTCLYAVHDITPHLRAGNNAVGIMLGNGFYNVNEEPGRYMKNALQRDYLPKRVQQDDLKAIIQLAFTYSDGTTEWLGSDESWKVAQGPIVYSCYFGGEDYDARKEKGSWDQAGYEEDGSWTPAAVVSAPGGTLRREMNPPNKVRGVFRPIKWTEPSPGIFVADLGQNFSGWFKLSISGASAGRRIVVTPAELLGEDGRVWQELQQKDAAWNYFVYTTKGEQKESWTPKFTYTGFRYVQIEGAVPWELSLSDQEQPGETGKPVVESLEGQLIYPDAPTIGQFSCSNPMWNSIHQIINWAIISNVKSVFTDCPHREKLGWLEETHLMGPSVMYNYGLANLFRKAVRDMADSQLADGLIPSISPEYAVFEEGFLDSPEWGCAYVLIPWYLYHWEGDAKILEEHYEGMARYAAYLTNRSHNGIVSHGLGDWADVGPNPPHAQNTPIPITATGYYYYVLKIMSEVSILLGKPGEASKYKELAEETNQAFHERFFDQSARQYGSGSQTSNSTPVALGMTDPAHVPDVIDHLCADVVARGYHTTSGDVGHRLLLTALAEGGRSDVIADMLNQTEDPSYGYQIVHGATALTEHWDGPTSGKSQNHFMLGHVEEWFYRHLAGIVRDYNGQTPKGADLVIKPFLAKGIQWTEASHLMPQGAVEIAWKRTDAGGVELMATLPPNLRAVICVPAAEGAEIRENGIPVEQIPDIRIMESEAGYVRYAVGSGTYRFTSSVPIQYPRSGE